MNDQDLPLYRISRPPLFYHKDGKSKIQAAYDACVSPARGSMLSLTRDPPKDGFALANSCLPRRSLARRRLISELLAPNCQLLLELRFERIQRDRGFGPLSSPGPPKLDEGGSSEERTR